MAEETYGVAPHDGFERGRSAGRRPVGQAHVVDGQIRLDGRFEEGRLEREKISVLGRRRLGEENDAFAVAELVDDELVHAYDVFQARTIDK